MILGKANHIGFTLYNVYFYTVKYFNTLIQYNTKPGLPGLVLKKGSRSFLYSITRILMDHSHRLEPKHFDQLSKSIGTRITQ